MLKNATAGRDDLTAQIEALERVAQQLDRDVDHLVWELRPTALDDLGLRAALANYDRTGRCACACPSSSTLPG